MSIWPFVIAGLVSGSVYGLAGVGLVLSYKTSGVFNFAHGALATIAAYLFYTLYVEHGVGWQISAVLAVLVLGVLLGLAFEIFARRMIQNTIALRIAGTVGAAILVQAGATLIYGTTPVMVTQFLPTNSFSVGGVVITLNQVIVVAVGVVVTAALYLFLQRSRLGAAMRAVVDNSELVSLSQFSPNSIRRVAWIVGCVLATLSGVLIAPTISLDPTQLTLLIVQSFGAAAIGRFINLPLTYVGGLALGVASSVATEYVSNVQFLAGLPASIPFIVLFLVVVFTPAGRLRLRAAVRLTRVVSRPRSSARVQVAAAVPPLILAALAPMFLGGHLLIWASGLTFVVLFASMYLLVRVAGQVSLCHVAFMAIGASTFARLTGQHGLPWFLALLLAALCVVPIGALLAIPASRLPVLYLGIATLGFGLAVQQMFYDTNIMFGQAASGLAVGRPQLFGLALTSDRAYYYLVLVIAVLSLLVITFLIRSRLGRVLRGLSDSPLALKSLGADERTTRVLVFCISAFLAALAGGLYAGVLGNVAAQTFDPIAALTYFVVIVISVGDVVWASIGAAVGIAIIPGYVETGTASQYLQVAFGVIAIIVAAGPPDRRLPGFVAAALRAGTRRKPGAAPEAAATERSAGPAALPERRRAGSALEIRDVSVSFRGVRAVDGVTLAARADAITGLIGPNGAGKTTIFNVCSGLVRPGAGQVVFDGQDLARAATAKRARMGLGRTFQQTELFGSMTVLENIALGCEAPMAGASPLSQLVTRPSERQLRAESVRTAVELCGLASMASATASSLSTGQRRLVELARSLAGPTRLLLLDEPSAGLARSETKGFGAILQRVRDELGFGIFLVEHDMDLVMSVCDYIYVLDFGKLIFNGIPSAVQKSKVVQGAYLGEPFESETVGAAALDSRLENE